MLQPHLPSCQTGKQSVARQRACFSARHVCANSVRSENDNQSSIYPADRHDEPLQQPTRRALLTGVLLSTALWSSAQPAQAERGLSRYIRKKRLDPLDTYVPVVLIAREQLVKAGEIMLEQPAVARDLLRKDAFDGLRENIRVLGEYAVINEKSKEAGPLVNGFFKSLEAFDQVLNMAVRESQPVPADAAKSNYASTLKALDDLLDTVPEPIMNMSRRLLEVTREKERAALEEATAAAAEETTTATELLAEPSATVLEITDTPTPVPTDADLPTQEAASPPAAEEAATTTAAAESAPASTEVSEAAPATSDVVVVTP